jgi:phosphate:Na+ symporter
MWFSPTHPELTGLDRLGAETPRQIANAHTVFNISNTLIFIWFTVQIGQLVERLIPDGALEDEGIITRSKYLDEELLPTPSLALDRVRLEVLHMGEQVDVMLQQIMPAMFTGNKSTLDSIHKLDDEVDNLYEQIVEYMGKISKHSLTEAQTAEFLKLMEAISDLENVGDIVETNLVVLGNQRISSGVSISDATEEVITGFHKVVISSVKLAVQAVSQNNKEVAQSVIDMKEDIAALADSAALHQVERLVVDEPNRISAYTIEMDIIEKLKRIYYFSKRMAKTVLHEHKE